MLGLRKGHLGADEWSGESCCRNRLIDFSRFRVAREKGLLVLIRCFDFVRASSLTITTIVAALSWSKLAR
jgi:hypothetical protein